MGVGGTDERNNDGCQHTPPQCLEQDVSRRFLSSSDFGLLDSFNLTDDILQN